MATNPTAGKKRGKKMETQVVRAPAPYEGTVKIDGTPLVSLLVELGKGARKGLRTAQPGLDEVLAELAAAVPTAGAAAGVSQTLYQGVVTDSTNLTALQQAAPAVVKLGEVMVDSQAVIEDAREHKIMKIADAIKSTAKHDKNPSVKTPFKKTLAYVAAIADKAVKTKAANKVAATPAASPAATPAAASPAATSAGGITPAAGH